MNPELTKNGFDAMFSLTVYGPLGVMALFGLIATIVLWRRSVRDSRVALKKVEEREAAFTKSTLDREAAFTATLTSALRAQNEGFAIERQDFKKHINEERDACEEERKAAKDAYAKLEERYLTKTETQLEKYNQLANALKDVVGSALRRTNRQTGGPSDGDT